MVVPFFPGEVQLLLLEGDLFSAAAIFSFSADILSQPKTSKTTRRARRLSLLSN